MDRNMLRTSNPFDLDLSIGNIIQIDRVNLSTWPTIDTIVVIVERHYRHVSGLARCIILYSTDSMYNVGDSWYLHKDISPTSTYQQIS